MQKLLVHVCCGPCFVAPYYHLRENDFRIYGYWYNPNIHPYTEYRKRYQTLKDFTESENIPMIEDDDYDLAGFLRNISYRESKRCLLCYQLRLTAAARIAKKGKFDAFTTTLLYSKFQHHELIKEVGYALEAEYGIPFHYEDFRQYWKEGIELSKEKEMYRQQYCGCIYSEYERYKNDSIER
jgi:hypothetical protein